MACSFPRLPAVLVLAAGAAWAGAAGPNGRWVQTYDPDGPVIGEWVELHDTGEADLGDRGGVYLRCPYRIEAATVVLTCSVKGKTKRLVLTIKDNFATLVNPSGAIYSRR